MTFPYNTTIDILTETNLATTGGGYNATWNTTETGVDANVQAVSAIENVKSGRDGNSGNYKFYLPSDTSITLDNRITYNSTDYLIVEFAKYPGTYIKIVCQEVDV